MKMGKTFFGSKRPGVLGGVLDDLMESLGEVFVVHDGLDDLVAGSTTPYFILHVTTNKFEMSVAKIVGFTDEASWFAVQDY